MAGRVNMIDLVAVEMLLYLTFLYSDIQNPSRMAEIRLHTSCERRIR